MKATVIALVGLTLCASLTAQVPIEIVPNDAGATRYLDALKQAVLTSPSFVLKSSGTRLRVTPIVGGSVTINCGEQRRPRRGALVDGGRLSSPRASGAFRPCTFPPERQMIEETIPMKAIAVTDQAAGTAGMKLVERPEPQPAINDVVVQVHASGFVPTAMAWPSTWTDRRDRDRTPSIPGHELAGVVAALGYGTTGLSVGQRVFGLADWHRGGTLAEYVAIEARNLAPLPGDVDFTVGASLPISGLTAWQGLFEHGRLRAGQSVIAHGAVGAVGSMVTQLAREFGASVIGTGRAADRQKALAFGAQEFVDLENDFLEDVGGVDLVFDVIGGDIGKRSARLIRAGGTLVSIVGPSEARPDDGRAIDFVVESDRAQLSEIVQRVRDGRLRTNIGNVSTLDKAVAAFNSTERRAGKTVIRVRA